MKTVRGPLTRGDLGRGAREILHFAYRAFKPDNMSISYFFISFKEGTRKFIVLVLSDRLDWTKEERTALEMRA